MRTILLISMIVTGQGYAEDRFELSDKSDRINYSIGHQIGMDFKRQQVSIDEQSLRLGLQDGDRGGAPAIEPAEMNSMLADLKRNITASMKKNAIQKIESRKRDEQQKRTQGEQFMLKNKTRDGVKTMPSGLQYKVLSEGKGTKPKIDDYVTFNYRAKTIDGREYDSSYKKDKPATYRANGVLTGFTEAIQMMQPGAKWELYIPPEQAYGRQGPLAHQTIILEVELLSVGQNIGKK